MGRIILISTISMLLYACTETCTNCYESKVEYRIVNQTNHKINICELYENTNETLKKHTIYSEDSLILNVSTISCGIQTHPFHNYTQIVYDDTLFVSFMNDFGNTYNLASMYNYKSAHSSKENIEVYRYVITNEDYQYAIEHRLQ